MAKGSFLRRFAALSLALSMAVGILSGIPAEPALADDPAGSLAGSIFAPDPSAWGTQNNNNWYYMSWSPNNGLYSLMDYYDNSASISWQREHFASDPNAVGEMYFIDQIHFFTGENGTRPVYAFKAPGSGRVQVDFKIHGVADMGVNAFVGESPVAIEGKERYTFTTTGSLPGAFTQVSFETSIIEGQWIYLQCSTTGSSRDGWLKEQSVTYLEEETEVDLTDTVFYPDPDKWGRASNNNWSYMYRGGNSDTLEKLTYYADSDTDIDWQKGTYSFDPRVKAEMLFISRTIFFVGENGARPAYVFTAPSGGSVQFTVHTHGNSQMYMEVYRNDELVKIDGSDRISFNTTGPLPGAFTEHTFTLDVKKNTKVALLGGSDDISAERGGYVNYYSAKYLSLNDEVEPEPVPELITDKPRAEGSALEWNRGRAYYTQLHELLAGDEPLTWVFVGDSITANDGDVSKGFRSYAEIFDSYLKGTLGRSDDRVVNTAVSGWNSGSVNFSRDIAPYDPDIVYIKLGTNDSFGSEAAARAFYSNMSNLYRQIIALGAIPVIAAANPFSKDWGNTMQTEQFAAMYPSVIRALAYEKDLLLVDYYSVYNADMDYASSHYFNPDTIHPNRNGMLVMAQTLIHDLGMETESSITGTDAGDLRKTELTDNIILADVDPADYIRDGSAVILSDVSIERGFVLIGGTDAMGAGTSMITRRSLAQYLNNNFQLGRGETLMRSAAAAKSMDYSALGSGKTILLLPEAYSASGARLWADASPQDIADAAGAAMEAGHDVILITPAPVYGSHAEEVASLADAVRGAADISGAALIDLNAYFAAVAGQVEDVKDAWYSSDTLNYAGINDAAILIGTAFGLDTVSYSDNSFSEDQTPENWGEQGLNNFYYYYQVKDTDIFQPLPFVSAGEADAVWTADRFSLAAGDFTFIGKDIIHAGNAYNPVKAFKTPYTGKVRITVKHRRDSNDASEGGTAGTMWIVARKNDEILTSDKGEEKIRMLGSGGSYLTDTYTVEVNAGDWLYVLIDAEKAAQGQLIEKVTYITMSRDQGDDKENDTDDTYIPDPSAWGTQDNNGWYYMYKGRDNVRRELTYRDGTANIEWQRNAFASDPFEVQEMYFINRSSFFCGELDTRPVYAFKCPKGGEAELTFITHGNEPVHIDVLRNSELLDTVALTTEGELSGYSLHTYRIDVKEGTWLYLECYTGDPAAREGYVSFYGVKYLSVNDEKETTEETILGKVFTPDMDVLKQNNNGWYYMYYDQLYQSYVELKKYGPNAAIDWQRNTFAFDPNLMSEMLIVTNGHFFTGENGSSPVYAFKCPSGGSVRLKVYTHGEDDVFMEVFHNDTRKDSFHFNTVGPLDRYTEHLIEMDVKAGDWIYMVCSTEGSHRDGWMSFYGVEYLSVNDARSTYSQPRYYAPDLGGKWGEQDNNSWSFQYLDKGDDLFRRLAFVGDKNEFEGTSEGGYEYLLIKPVEMHPSVKGDPAKVFTLGERGGKVQISFAAWLQNPDHSPTGTGIAVYHNGVKVWPENEEFYKTPGRMTIQRIVIDAAKGDDIAVVLDSLDNISYDATNVRVCAKYLGYNDHVRTEWPVYPVEVPEQSTLEPAPINPTAGDGTENEPSGQGPDNASQDDDIQEPQGSNMALILTIAGIGVLALGGAVAALIIKKRKSDRNAG